MASREAERSKDSFDAVADAYDMYRPPPPPEVVAAVVTMAGLHEGSSVLEIGCGTGQLSVPLAQRGVELLAVELGPHLAARARHNLQPFPKARVEVSAFEDWPMPAQRFDGVVVANAFHWLDPDVRISKSAEALHPGGHLVILCVHHVQGGTPGFFADTQPHYVGWGLSDDPAFELPSPNDVPTMYPELEAHAEFSSVERRRYEVPISLSTASYVGWLTTDSLVNTLHTQSRQGFLDDIGHLIDGKYGGRVARNFLYEVIAARRADA